MTKQVKEDGEGGPVPANNAGAGGVEGIGVGPKGEPGVPAKRKKIAPFRRFISNVIKK